MVDCRRPRAAGWSSTLQMAVTDQRAAALIVVAGRVQGVGYRAFAERCARRLGVDGYVTNLPDGRVRVHAEGVRPSIEALLAELRQGPRLAQVADVALTWVTPTGRYHGFDTHFGEGEA
jgi:acylphosphatase